MKRQKGERASLRLTTPCVEVARCVARESRTSIGAARVCCRHPLYRRRHDLRTRVLHRQLAPRLVVDVVVCRDARPRAEVDLAARIAHAVCRRQAGYSARWPEMAGSKGSSHGLQWGKPSLVELLLLHFAEQSTTISLPWTNLQRLGSTDADGDVGEGGPLGRASSVGARRRRALCRQRAVHCAR